MDKFDKEGNPLSLMEWAMLMEDMAYRRVAWDVLPGGGHLSTVWLGLDHGFYREGPPIIFESMAFPTDQYPDACERYSTLEEAIQGHQILLAKLTPQELTQ